MATLYTHRAENLQRTWILFTAFIGLVSVLGWLFARLWETPIIFPLAVGLSLLSSIVSFWFSDRLVLSLAGAKPIEKRDDPELYRLVENLSITAGLPMPRLYVVEDPAPNAFATGRNATRAAVAVTTGLRSLLTEVELEGVLAHELSHIGNRDMLVATVAAVFAGAVVTMVNLFARLHWYGGRRSDGDRRAGALTAAGFLAAVVLAPLAATLLRLAISRQREYLADASGALLTRYPEGLASALEKIGASARPLRRAPEAIAHLWLSDPTPRVRRTQFAVRLFMSHPPVEDRVRRLRALGA